RPTFTWQPTPTVAGRANGTASCLDNCTLCGGMHPCSLCGQHLPPTTGDEYDLQFTVDGAVAYRVLTTLQSFTPPEALWATWGGKTVSLNAVRILFEVNRVQEGPFQPTKPISFSVVN